MNVGSGKSSVPPVALVGIECTVWAYPVRLQVEQSLHLLRRVLSSFGLQKLEMKCTHDILLNTVAYMGLNSPGAPIASES